MFSIEGQVVTRKNPDVYLGSYGAYHQATFNLVDAFGRVVGEKTQTKIYTGSPEYVEQYCDKLLQNGVSPEEITFELIKSREQAEKYVGSPSTTDFAIERFRKPRFDDVLNQIAIPEGFELLSGEAQLWQELRLPLPVKLYLAWGKLQAARKYHPRVGWYNPYYRVVGSRTRKVIALPKLGERTWVKSRVELVS